MDCKVFVDTDSDVRLARRLRRDILERGRDVKGVLKQYMRFVKPAYDTYIDTTKNVADIIVPRGTFHYRTSAYSFIDLMKDHRITNVKNSAHYLFISTFFSGGENEIGVNLIVNLVHQRLHEVSDNIGLQYKCRRK